MNQFVKGFLIWILLVSLWLLPIVLYIWLSNDLTLTKYKVYAAYVIGGFIYLLLLKLLNVFYKEEDKHAVQRNKV